MTHLIFHTMGKISHVRAALNTQGITEDTTTPISIYNMTWAEDQTGKTHDKFEVTEFGSIQPTQPNLIVVACGSKAFATYQNAKIVKKNIGIEKTRGQYIPFGNTSFLTTSYDPDISFPDFVSGFRADASVAYRVARTGLIHPTLPVPVRRTRSVGELISILDADPTTPITVSLDLETMGLDAYKIGAKIVAVSLTFAEVGTDRLPRCEVIYTLGYSELEWTLLSEGLNAVFNHPMIRVIGANLKYDLAWLALVGVTCTQFNFDTLLAGSMVDENRWNGLNQHAKTYTDFGGYDDQFNAEYDKAHMEDVPEGKVVEYAGGDSQACYYSAKKILHDLRETSRGSTGEIQKTTPYNFYHTVLHPAARAFERVEQRGMYVDREAFDEFGKWAKKQRAGYEVQLSAMVPQAIKGKFEKWENFPPAMISHYLFEHLGIEPKQTTAKSGKPSTAWSHLQSFQAHPECGEFVTALKELNAIKKLHSTYYVGWLKHLRDDGLFHPTYWLHRAGMGKEGGAVTGRGSVTDPAFQTLPKHTEVAKRLRKCFPAPPGHYIAGLDYSQGELRIVACVANETTMLKVYENDGDLHAVTAAKMLEMPLPTFEAKEESDPVWYERSRRNGKAGNFGLVYGMSADGYVDYAWNTYGVVLTHAEAAEQRDTFFETYPRLLTYHGVQTQSVKAGKQVKSPLGRVRHLPHIDSSDQFFSGKARRQAINSPIQATLSDMSYWSIARLHSAFPNIWVWGNIHDQNMLYVPIDGWEDQVAQAQDVMENLPFEDAFGWKPQLKFPVDALIGPNLGELYDTGKFDG